MVKGLVDKQVVIVTGCANKKGIGFATVQSLSEQGAGTIIMVDNNPVLDSVVAEVNGVNGTQVHGFVGDVSDEAFLKTIVDYTIEKYGRIDSVVNSAAINTPGTAIDTTRKSFINTMLVNVWSQIALAGLVIPHMIKQGGGAIVNVSSANAFVSERGLLPYVTSKGANKQATQQMALEYAKDNIRITAVAPGALHTGFNQPHYNYTGDSEQAVNAQIGDIHPTGKIIEPREVAMPIVFLCSDYATAIVGETLLVDAGYSIH